MDKPSLWLGEPNLPLRLALGKIAEEANELGAIASRCAIQGLADADPKTSKPNRRALLDEIADVAALSIVIYEEAQFTPEEMQYMSDRAEEKANHKREWLQMVRVHLYKADD